METTSTELSTNVLTKDHTNITSNFRDKINSLLNDSKAEILRYGIDTISWSYNSQVETITLKVDNFELEIKLITKK